MKKTLIIAGIFALLASSTASYAATNTQTSSQPQKQTTYSKEKISKDKRPNRPNLDERLKLTEEQKTKAHEIRMQGHEKIKPIMDKIKAKHEEIKTIIEDTSLTQEQKDNKTFAVEKELLNLKQQARKIRTENMKKFESILTDEQKTELEKIKQEARAKHEAMKEHKEPRGPKGPHRPMPFGEQPPIED